MDNLVVVSEINEILGKKEKKRTSRKGCKYNIASTEIRKQCVEDMENYSLEEICQKYNVKNKNLRRWIKQGADRKKGTGRKIQDPEMNSKLLEWLKNEIQVTGKIPKVAKAKEVGQTFLQIPSFKFSKGWYAKFIKQIHEN